LIEYKKVINGNQKTKFLTFSFGSYVTTRRETTHMKDMKDIEEDTRRITMLR